MSGSVLLYNNGGQEFMRRVSLKHAYKMLWRGVARVLEVDEEATNPAELFEVPKSLELVRYIVTKWHYEKTGNVPFSKKGVLVRDDYTCCYCGKFGRGKVDTVDHVMPKWQGNSNSWMNSVACCFDCNQLKGGRSPKEAGMKMLFTPRVPSFEEAFAYTRKR